MKRLLALALLISSCGPPPDIQLGAGVFRVTCDAQEPPLSFTITIPEGSEAQLEIDTRRCSVEPLRGTVFGL